MNGDIGAEYVFGNLLVFPQFLLYKSSTGLFLACDVIELEIVRLFFYSYTPNRMLFSKLFFVLDSQSNVVYTLTLALQLKIVATWE